MPLYGSIIRQLNHPGFIERLKRQPFKFITFVIYGRYRLQSLNKINAATKEMLYLKQKFQEDDHYGCYIRRGSLRICLQGEKFSSELTSDFGLTSTLRGSFLVEACLVEQVTAGIEGIMMDARYSNRTYYPFYKNRINSYPATPCDARGQVGSMYHYPGWKLIGDFQDIYGVLQARLFGTQTIRQEV